MTWFFGIIDVYSIKLMAITTVPRNVFYTGSCCEEINKAINQRKLLESLILFRFEIHGQALTYIVKHY